MKKFILGVLLLTIGSFAVAEDGPGNSGEHKLKCQKGSKQVMYCLSSLDLNDKKNVLTAGYFNETILCRSKDGRFQLQSYALFDEGEGRQPVSPVIEMKLDARRAGSAMYVSTQAEDGYRTQLSTPVILSKKVSGTIAIISEKDGSSMISVPVNCQEQ